MFELIIIFIAVIFIVVFGFISRVKKPEQMIINKTQPSIVEKIESTSNKKIKFNEVRQERYYDTSTGLIVGNSVGEL